MKILGYTDENGEYVKFGNNVDEVKEAHITDSLSTLITIEDELIMGVSYNHPELGLIWVHPVMLEYPESIWPLEVTLTDHDENHGRYNIRPKWPIGVYGGGA